MTWLGLTWLAPVALAVGVLGALGVVAAHVLARHRPPRQMLPTARFVPAARPASATRPSTPSDLALLALRMLAVLLAAAAFARPVRAPKRGSVARVVAVDRSRDLAAARAAADSARALLREGDVLVPFDSAASPALEGAAATRALDSLAATRSAGSLTVGMLAAMRAGMALAPRTDSVELVLVSPLASGEADAATQAARAAWPGRVRVSRVMARAADTATVRVALRGAPDDPLAAALSLEGLTGGADASVRLVRDVPTAADSAWAAADSSRVLVHWPADAVAAGWTRRQRADTAGGVAIGEVVVVAPFARRAAPPEGRVVARWADGEPAATERALGAGCVRAVAVPVPAVGDLALRTPFRRFVRALAARCAVPGTASDRSAVSGDSLAARLAGTGPVAASSALARLAPAASTATPLVAWLLGGALVALLAEQLLRRRREPEAA